MIYIDEGNQKYTNADIQAFQTYLISTFVN